MELSLIAGDNGRMVYSIGSSGNDDFAVAQNGTVYTTRLLDREVRSLYNLVVVATDQAKDPQQRLSSTVQVGMPADNEGFLRFSAFVIAYYNFVGG